MHGAEKWVFVPEDWKQESCDWMFLRAAFPLPTTNLFIKHEQKPKVKSDRPKTGWLCCYRCKVTSPQGKTEQKKKELENKCNTRASNGAPMLCSSERVSSRRVVVSQIQQEVKKLQPSRTKIQSRYSCFKKLTSL